MSTTIDPIMERASRALVAMDYLTCEGLCLDALAAARSAGAWTDYARVLLPLQEARRQRRMIAADAGVFIGKAADLAPVEAGCLVVIAGPASDAAQLEAGARQARRFVEVLWVDGDTAGPRWTVSAFAATGLRVDRPMPPTGKPDARWYLEASEALGDAAIAAVDADPACTPGTIARVDRLEAMLRVVADHEKLHQRLGDAARALRKAGAAA